MLRTAALSLPLLAAGATFFASGSAAASPNRFAQDPAIAAPAKRAPPPTNLERKGFFMSVGANPGVVLGPVPFTPVTRIDYQIGGGLSDNFTLGLDLSGTMNLNRQGAAFGGDLVATGYMWRGLFIRAGAGATSSLQDHDETRPDAFDPAIGGRAGLGYEFRLGERLGLALVGDYDGRYSVSGAYRQTVFFGLRFAGYLHKKK